MLSPTLVCCTPNFSRSVSNRFDMGVCAGVTICLPPFSCPERPPTTTTGTVDIIGKTVTFLADTGWRDTGRRAFKTPIVQPH